MNPNFRLLNSVMRTCPESTRNALHLASGEAGGVSILHAWLLYDDIRSIREGQDAWSDI